MRSQTKSDNGVANDRMFQCTQKKSLPSEESQNDKNNEKTAEEQKPGIEDSHGPETILNDDPGTWPHIDESVRRILIMHGPVQVKNVKFPSDKNGRRFTTANYTRKLCNGEEIVRGWLLYSISKNAVFCFCCKLFSTKKISLSSDDGFSDWKNLSGFLSSHERSPSHFRAFQSWIELSSRLSCEKTIDKENLRMFKAESEHWAEVLKRVFCIVQYLASQGLAFRGNSDKLFEKDNGNFLQLVEHTAKFDLVLSEHLRKVSSHESHVHYLSKTIQDEFIYLLSSKVRDTILEDMHLAKYYSIILDCTPDAGHIEQMTMIVRFVKIEEGKGISIREHFLGFVPVDDTSGVGLTKVLLDKLKELNIPLSLMRGQGYDNGSNMKGKKAGVQNKILELNPRALFVPCGNHTLNLVVNDAALKCPDAVNFFSIVQEIFNFFSASTYRWSILKKHVSSLTAKPLCNTRWESRINALSPLRYQIGEIYDALLESSNDEKLDAFGRNQASGIAKKLTKFSFLCSLVTWYQILFRVNIVSKELQKVSLDLSCALEHLKSVQKWVFELRSDKGLEDIIIDAKELAETLGSQPNFENEEKIRPRKAKKQFTYEEYEEPISSGKNSVKVKFFYTVLDQTISSLEERFTLLKDHSKNFEFLYDIPKAAKENTKTIREYCQNLTEILTHNDESDIDGKEMEEEISVLGTMLNDSNTSPMNVLQFITKHSLMSAFPNVYVALRVLLTLPVSVASGERSFSKLKLIKNYLRATISENRLNGLSMIAIEKEILHALDRDQILKEFSEMKARQKF